MLPPSLHCHHPRHRLGRHAHTTVSRWKTTTTTAHTHTQINQIPDARIDGSDASSATSRCAGPCKRITLVPSWKGKASKTTTHVCVGRPTANLEEEEDETADWVTRQKKCTLCSLLDSNKPHHRHPVVGCPRCICTMTTCPFYKRRRLRRLRVTVLGAHMSAKQSR